MQIINGLWIKSFNTMNTTIRYNFNNRLLDLMHYKGKEKTSHSVSFISYINPEFHTPYLSIPSSLVSNNSKAVTTDNCTPTGTNSL